MTKSELIEKIVERTSLPHLYVRDAVEAFIETINTTVGKGERVKISGFGIFSQKIKRAGPARNPKTGERVIAESTKSLKFSPSKR
jgi:DNA-binding protein HU-beta